MRRRNEANLKTQGLGEAEKTIDDVWKKWCVTTSEAGGSGSLRLCSHTSEGSSRLAAILGPRGGPSHSWLSPRIWSSRPLQPPHICCHGNKRLQRPSLRAVCDVMSVVTWLLSGAVDGCCWILGEGGSKRRMRRRRRRRLCPAGGSHCVAAFSAWFSPWEPELKNHVMI